MPGPVYDNAPTLSAMVLSLTARVNQLDGVNLLDPTRASVAQLQAQILGLNNTLNNVANTIQALISNLQTTVDTLQSTLNAHLGVPVS